MLIEGELSAESDGVMTTLTGSGSFLVWDLEDLSVAASAPRVERHELVAVARTARRSGLRIEIRERGRPVLEIGDVHSTLGRLLTGSFLIRPRSLRRLLRLRATLR